MAEELGLEFEHIPVVQASRFADPQSPDAQPNTNSAAFRRISPTGRIPVVDDNGLILHESLAINLHLARTNPSSPLAPRDHAEDAQMTMWTLWAATECELAGVQVIVNRAIRTPDDRDEPALAAALTKLDKAFRVLGAALDAGGGHPVGARFTVADLNLAEVLRYAQPAPELFADHPTVAAWLTACQDRPAFKDVTRRRLAEPLPEGWQSAYRRPTLQPAS
jgi:glutathione S-transferase